MTFNLKQSLYRHLKGVDTNIGKYPKLCAAVELILQGFYKFLYGKICVVGRVFAPGPGDRGLIPGRVVSDTNKGT